MTRQAHPHIVFAMEHFRAWHRTFNATSAIWQMQQLVEEAEEIGALLEAHPRARLPFGLPHFPAYFLVGYVTCLEWHARSRLTDLLSYAPESTTADDLKAVADGKKLLEMVKARLTVPELVGASTHVSQLRDYVAVFDRVFAAVQAGSKAEAAVKSGDIEGEQSAWRELDQMYDTRHRLVHEISYEQVGHRNMRNNVSIDEATRLGKLTLRCMKAVEGVITDHAPPDFPNLLDVDGNAVSEQARLVEDIAECERRLRTAADVSTGRYEDIGIDYPGLGGPMDLGVQYLMAEMRWLDTFRPAGWQYHNPADDLRIRLLAGRLAYLRELEEVLRKID